MLTHLKFCECCTLSAAYDDVRMAILTEKFMIQIGICKYSKIYFKLATTKMPESEPLRQVLPY